MDTVTRAFELARDGTCKSLRDIREALKREQCDSVDLHFDSALLKKQLQALVKAASADDS